MLHISVNTELHFIDHILCCKFLLRYSYSFHTGEGVSSLYVPTKEFLLIYYSHKRVFIVRGKGRDGGGVALG